MIYAVDHLDRLAILDAERGTRLSTMPLGDVQIKILNQQTDRIYLASDAGVVQCLHELGQSKPLVYTPPRLKRVPPASPSSANAKKPRPTVQLPAKQISPWTELAADENAGRRERRR